MKTALLSLLSSQAFYAYASAEVVFKTSSVVAPFIEQFGEDWDSRWKPSAATKQIPEGFSLGENDDPETLFRYRGEWAVESPWKNGVPGDQGLVAKTSAAHHAISVSFPKVLNPDGKDLVVQYDLKLQEDLQCGGAYIKLLTDSKQGIKYNEFDDRTPYTVMFGPDKCGTTNKVHFIFRHQNPKTGKWEEKHLRNAPSIRADTNVHLYTLVVRPDNTFTIYIDQESVKTGSLLEEFDPPVNPPKEIDDPSDVKPADWVEEPKIPDPEAVKPADWDEEAPRMIPDEEAEKPADWLEDEPQFVSDPSAEKPEDWDDEEDGKWVAPQVPNPKCEKAAGCGEWVRPSKPNPNYKGKWYSPLVDNPAYKGPWEPKKIPNPDFFEDLNPSKFTKISGVGIEIWTMQGGIMYDNFYVGHSLDDANKFADETFKLKKQLDEEADASAKKAAEETVQKPSDEPKSLIETLTALLTDFVNLLLENPAAAVTQYPSVAAGSGLIILSPILLYVLLLRGPSKDATEYAKRKKGDISTPDVKDKNEEDEDADDEKEQ